MTDAVKVAVEAACAAGKIQSERADDIRDISEKGELLNRNGTDPTISANKREMMTIQKAVFTVRV